MRVRAAVFEGFFVTRSVVRCRTGRKKKKKLRPQFCHSIEETGARKGRRRRDQKTCREIRMRRCMLVCCNSLFVFLSRILCFLFLY